MEFKLVERNVESSELENLQKQLNKSTKRNQHRLKLGEYDENVEEIRDLVEQYLKLAPMIREEMDFMFRYSFVALLVVATDFFFPGPLISLGLVLTVIVGVPMVLRHRSMVQDRDDIFKDIEYLHGENCCTIYSIVRDLKSELEGPGKDYTVEDMWLDARKETPALVIIDGIARSGENDDQESN